jgi:hypothetical protein
MTCREAALLLGRYIIRGACRPLPAGVSNDRCQEWTAELPAILDPPDRSGDPDARPGFPQVMRMLAFAIDQHRTVHHFLVAEARRNAPPIERPSLISGDRVAGVLDFFTGLASGPPQRR